MRPQTSLAEKKGLRLDDEVRFIRSWLEKPLAIGAVTPSGRFLARTMARYVDTRIPGPVIELGPGTGPVTEALVARGVHPSRLVLVEFNPIFCRLLRSRYPEATVDPGRRLCPEAALAESAGAAGRRGGFGPAAPDQAAAHARPADQRSLRADAPACAVRAIHLFDDHVADPESACRGSRPRPRPRSG